LRERRRAPYIGDLRERRRVPYIGEQQAQGMNLDVTVKALSYCRGLRAIGICHS
jgi:hypothetical protein